MTVISKLRRATNRNNQPGFTLIQTIIIVAIVSVVTAFGAIGVVRARAHMRLAGSARQFASFAEKARADSVRRHGMGGAMSSLLLLSTTSYSVTMDFDNNGVIDATDTRTFSLENGVSFAPEFVGTTITFDWRGRSLTGQVSPTMNISDGSITLITISGSGDITLDSESFPDGSIPDVVLNGDPTGDIRPDPPPNPTPGGGLTSPTPTPTPNPDPDATPTPAPPPPADPTPTPCTNQGIDCRDNNPTPTPTPQPTVTPTPTPDPSSGQCTLTASPGSLSLGNRATGSVSLAVQNSSGSTSVSLSGNSNPSHISVTLAPGQSSTVSGSGTVTFTVVMNGTSQNGTISFTASSPCSASASVGVNQ